MIRCAIRRALVCVHQVHRNFTEISRKQKTPGIFPPFYLFQIFKTKQHGSTCSVRERVESISRLPTLALTQAAMQDPSSMTCFFSDPPNFIPSRHPPLQALLFFLAPYPTFYFSLIKKCRTPELTLFAHPSIHLHPPPLAGLVVPENEGTVCAGGTHDVRRKRGIPGESLFERRILSFSSPHLLLHVYTV